MAHLSYLGRDGKRTTTGLVGNRSLAAHLKDLDVINLAVRNGVEKRENNEWRKVPLTYVVSPSDELRVTPPVQSPSKGIMKLLVEVLHQVRPKNKSRSSK